MQWCLESRHIGFGVVAASSCVHRVQSRVGSSETGDDGAGSVILVSIALNIVVHVEWSADIGSSNVLVAFFLLPEHGHELASGLLVSHGPGGRAWVRMVLGKHFALRVGEGAVSTNITRGDSLTTVTPKETAYDVQDTENETENATSHDNG